MARTKGLRTITVPTNNDGQLQSRMEQPGSYNDVEQPSQSIVQFNSNFLIEASHDPPPVIEDTADSQEERRVRGPTLLTDIWNLPLGKKIDVTFNKRGQAVGDQAKKLSGFLGMVGRTADLTPIHIADWRLFPKSNKLKLLDLVKRKFVIPSHGEKWVLKSLGKKWREYKCKLRTAYYERYKTLEQLLAHKPPRVPRDQWVILVSYWTSEKGKKRSQKNRASRAKQKMPHTAGSKSFACLAEEMAVDGIEPSRGKLFIETHKERKDGRPIDEESARAVEMIKEKFSQLSNSNELENVTGAENDVYSQVLGPDKNGQIRGLGLGARIDNFRVPSGVLITQDVVETNNIAVKKLENDMKEMELRHVEEMRAMKENQARLEAQLINMFSANNGSNNDIALLSGQNETFWRMFLDAQTTKNL